MSILQTLGISIMGIVVVFIVLILLMIVITILAAIMKKTNKKQNETPAEAEQAPVLPARGSCGEIKTFDVPDRTAAMVMAIVADELGEPLNTLRFTSIREVKE